MREPFTVKMEPTEQAMIHRVATMLGIPSVRVEVRMDEEDEARMNDEGDVGLDDNSDLDRGEFWSSGVRLGRFDIK
jgi:hypothetical protein